MSITKSTIQHCENWLRLAICVDEPVRLALLNVLHNDGPNIDPSYTGLPRDPVLLYQTFTGSQGKQQINQLKARGVLKQDQIDLLIPGTKSSTESQTFDSTVILVLIRNFTTLQIMNNDWRVGNLLPTDNSLAANAVRAVALRNFVYHYGNISGMKKLEFNCKWTEAERIMKGLKSIVDIKTYKSATLDPNSVSIFAALYKYLQSCHDKLQDSHETLQDSHKKLQDSHEVLQIKVQDSYEVLEENFKESHEVLQDKVKDRCEVLEEKLQDSHEILKEKLEDSHEILKEKLEDSHEILKEKLEDSHEILKGKHEKLDQSHEELRISHEKLMNELQDKMSSVNIHEENLVELNSKIENIAVFMEQIIKIEESIKQLEEKINLISEVKVQEHVTGVEDKISQANLWNIQQPISSFVGRSKEIENIKNSLSQQQSVVIYGLGGVGKTEVVRKYISDYGAEAFSTVVWLEADDKNVLEASLQDFLAYHDICGTTLRMKATLQKLFDLVKQESCLFVLDNVINFESIQEFVSALRNQSQFKLLITSQNGSWGDQFEQMFVEVFTPEIAVSVLKKEVSGNDEDVAALAEELEYLPLALQQARCYIRKQKIDLMTYLKHFERSKKKLLNVSLLKLGETSYAKTVLTVWKMAYDILKSNDDCKAIDLLNILAYMNGKKISTELFKYSDDFSDEFELSLLLDDLKEYSLITCRQSESHDTHFKIISIHKLVQFVVISYQDNASVKRYQKLLLDIMQVTASMKHKENVLYVDQEKLWKPHFMSLWKQPNLNQCIFAEITKDENLNIFYTCDWVDEEDFTGNFLFTLISYLEPHIIDGTDIDKFGIYLNLLNRYGLSLCQKGLSQECIGIYKKLLSYVLIMYDHTDDTYRSYITCYATALDRLTFYKNAQIEFASIDDSIRNTGYCNETCLWFFHCYAKFLLNQGDIEKALININKSYGLANVWDCTFGFIHTALLKGEILHVNGRFEESRLILEELLNDFANELEQNKRVMFQIKYMIAKNDEGEGNITKALEQYEEIYTLCKEDNLMTSYYLNTFDLAPSLALVLMLLKRYKESLVVAQDNFLQRSEKNIVEDITVARYYLAKAQLCNNMIEEALNNFHMVQKFNSNHDEKHVELKRMEPGFYMDLIIIYKHMKIDLAEKRQNLGDSHADTKHALEICKCLVNEWRSKVYRK